MAQSRGNTREDLALTKIFSERPTAYNDYYDITQAASWGQGFVTILARIEAPRMAVRIKNELSLGPNVLGGKGGIHDAIFH